MSAQATLIGIIFMLVLGPAVGNYATSYIHRLPKNQSPFEKHPYCPSCNTFLQPKDLFPILSYLLLRAKCRYCQVKIPPVYTFVEVACGAVFIINFLLFGMSEAFLLVTAVAVGLVTLAALEYQRSVLQQGPIFYVLALALTWSALQAGSIYPAVSGCVTLGALGLAIWYFNGRKTEQLPVLIWAVTLGMCLPMIPALLSFGLYLLARQIVALRFTASIAAMLVYAGLLFPQWPRALFTVLG